MSDDYLKGTFVYDYLESINVNLSNVAEAISDDNLEKSYKLIKDNPSITKEEFLKAMDFEDESFWEPYESLIVKEIDYLRSINVDWMEVKFLLDYDNCEIIKTLLTEKPSVSREEFLKRIGVEDIKAFEEEIKEYIFFDKD